MARIARLVVPGLPRPTISPGAVIGASSCFSRPTTIAPIPGAPPRRHTSLGPLSNAQSRPPGVRRRTRLGRGRSLPRRAGAIPRRSALVPMDGPSVPGSLWRGGDG
jgi:hypothetical protein